MRLTCASRPSCAWQLRRTSAQAADLKRQATRGDAGEAAGFLKDVLFKYLVADESQQAPTPSATATRNVPRISHASFLSAPGARGVRSGVTSPDMAEAASAKARWWELGAANTAGDHHETKS